MQILFHVILKTSLNVTLRLMSEQKRRDFREKSGIDTAENCYKDLDFKKFFLSCPNNDLNY